MLNIFPKEVHALIQTSVKNEDFSIEAECLKKDGSLLQIEAMGKSSPYGDNPVEIMAIRDENKISLKSS